MKNSKQVLGLLMLTAALFTGCQKEENGETYVQLVSEERATPQDFADLKAIALNNMKQTFQIDAGAIATIITQNGVQISINGACLNNNGASVSGMFDLEVIEIFSRGDMLAANKATMGMMPNGDKALLVSGGEFSINASQNGDPLSLTCPMQVVVPADLTGGPDFDMTLWDGIIGADCDNPAGCDDVVWIEQNLDGAGVGGLDIEEGPDGRSTYSGLFNDFGWTNVDKFWSDPRPKTTLLVDVPAGFNDNNSVVYISYDGEGSSLAFLDVYDESTELFSEHYGQIPVGLECHVIFASEDDGDWLYAIKAVTIAANGTITILDTDMETTTESGLKAAINALP